MSILGAPEARVLITVHVHPKPDAGIHVHVGNEELPVRLEQEKCSVAISPEPGGVLFHETLYLGLRETEFFHVRRECIEHL